MTDPKLHEKLELASYFAGSDVTASATRLDPPQDPSIAFTLGDMYQSMTQAVKYDADKVPMSLLSREALEQTAKVLAFGAKKYAAHNWRKGFLWSRPLSAAQRHLLAFQDGEDLDPESGLSHLAHAMCCIMFLLEFEKTHRELDDRWKP